MKYIYSTSQMSKLSLTLHTFSVTGSVAGLFLIVILECNKNYITLALDCVLKNSERMISMLGIYRRDRNKNIITENNI